MNIGKIEKKSIRLFSEIRTLASLLFSKVITFPPLENKHHKHKGNNENGNMWHCACRFFSDNLHCRSLVKHAMLSLKATPSLLLTLSKDFLQ